MAKVLGFSISNSMVRGSILTVDLATKIAFRISTPGLRHVIHQL